MDLLAPDVFAAFLVEVERSLAEKDQARARPTLSPEVRAVLARLHADRRR